MSTSRCNRRQERGLSRGPEAACEQRSEASRNPSEQRNKLRFIHGPYTADAFRTGAGAPNVTYAKSGLIRMDALASSSHIGLVYARNADGTDQIIEAKGEAYGTNIWTRTYRGSSSYGGVRRLGWSA